MIWPGSSERHPLAAYTALLIKRRNVETNIGIETEFELQMSGANRVDSLKIGWTSGDYGAIRQMAEEVGQFLDLGILDDTDDDPTIRDAEEFGKSIKEAAKVSDEELILPPLPENSKLEYEFDGSRIEIHFRRMEYSNLGCFLFFAILVSIPVVGFIATSPSLALKLIVSGIFGNQRIIP